MRIQFVTRRLRAPRLHMPADLTGTRLALLACVGIALLSHGLPVAAAAVETTVQGAPVQAAPVPRGPALAWC